MTMMPAIKMLIGDWYVDEFGMFDARNYGARLAMRRELEPCFLNWFLIRIASKAFACQLSGRATSQGHRLNSQALRYPRRCGQSNSLSPLVLLALYVLIQA